MRLSKLLIVGRVNPASVFLASFRNTLVDHCFFVRVYMNVSPVFVPFLCL